MTISKIPAPEQGAASLCQGQRVRVVLNENNKTLRVGTIEEICWHRARKKFYYHLRQDGKAVSKRYFEEDLRLLE